MGDKKVTIYTLAQMLNMSPSAVSRAFNPGSKLNKEKRATILKAAQECGYVRNKVASRLSQESIRIGVLICGCIEAYYKHLIDGVNVALGELQSYKVVSDVRVLEGENNTPENSTAILDEFSSARCDGVVIHGAYTEQIVKKVETLTARGIHVVTLHEDLPASPRLFASTSDTDTIGRIVVQLFDIFLQGSARNVVVFSGSMQSPNQQGLMISFLANSAKAGIRLLAHYDTLDLLSFSQRLVEEAFHTYSDIDGIYISSANAIPICRYVESHGLQDRVCVIASDVFPQLNDYIERGVVRATIYDDPFRQGRKSVEELYLHIAEGKEIPPIIMTNPQIVLKSNLGLYR